MLTQAWACHLINVASTDTQLYFRSCSHGGKSLFTCADTTGIIVTAGLTR
ncbi:MAG: hypothetical protein ABSA77_08755 [Thermoguttaceae bacterium]